MASPYEVVDIRHNALLRMFWLKRDTHRLMVQMGFREIGDELEFRNTEEDRNAVESCMNVLSFLRGNVFICNVQLQEDDSSIT